MSAFLADLQRADLGLLAERAGRVDRHHLQNLAGRHDGRIGEVGALQLGRNPALRQQVEGAVGTGAVGRDGDVDFGLQRLGQRKTR